MPGPCTPLGSWGGVERRQGLPWAIFCALLPQGRLSEGQRESTVRSCRHISRAWEVAEERSLWAADRPSFRSSSSSHPLRAEFGCRALKIVLGSPPRRVCRVSSWQSCTVWFSFNPDLFLCSPSLRVTTVIYPKHVLITCVVALLGSYGINRAEGHWLWSCNTWVHIWTPHLVAHDLGQVMQFLWASVSLFVNME